MTRGLDVAFLCAVAAAFPVTGLGQSSDSLSMTDKFHFHAENMYSPLAIAGTAAYAGIPQADGAPKEWGQGAGAYASVLPPPSPGRQFTVLSLSTIVIEAQPDRARSLDRR